MNTLLLLLSLLTCPHQLSTYGWFDPLDGHCPPELPPEYCDPAAGHIVSYPTPVGDLSYGDWRQFHGKRVRIQAFDGSVYVDGRYDVRLVLTYSSDEEWFFWMETDRDPPLTVDGWVGFTICILPREIFFGDFETGDLSQWSASVP